MIPRKKKLAIIGNGMGACRLLDELARRNAFEQYETDVFGEEQGGAYNRILLGRVLAGDLPDSIVTKTPEWYDAHNVRLIHKTRVKRLDTLRKLVETLDGQSRRYEIAVLATGSIPLVPPIEGMRGEDGELRSGVFVYRNIGDCLRIRDYARVSSSAVVVGGGLLGLEAAKVLAELGLHVTVIQGARYLMNTQLDEIGGNMLSRQIERCGIFARLGKSVSTIHGDERVTGVILDDGASLPADMVVLACGVRPRIDAARASGLPINQGILVNDALATEVPGVYAFGECAEHRGKTYGIVSPVWEQAAVLADVLAGAPSSTERYRGSKIYTRLKVAGVDVASMGVLEPEHSNDEVVQVIHDRRDAYQKLVVRDGKLIGAMLVGSPESAGRLVQSFDRGDELPRDPLELLCQGHGRTSGAPAERTICGCNKVTERTIREAIAAGATSVALLGEATKAGTSCGSCKGELGQLIATLAPTLEPSPLRVAV